MIGTVRCWLEHFSTSLLRKMYDECTNMQLFTPSQHPWRFDNFFHSSFFDSEIFPFLQHHPKNRFRSIHTIKEDSWFFSFNKIPNNWSLSTSILKWRVMLTVHPYADVSFALILPQVICDANQFLPWLPAYRELSLPNRSWMQELYHYSTSV